MNIKVKDAMMRGRNNVTKMAEIDIFTKDECHHTVIDEDDILIEAFSTRRDRAKSAPVQMCLKSQDAIVLGNALLKQARKVRP